MDDTKRPSISRLSGYIGPEDQTATTLTIPIATHVAVNETSPSLNSRSGKKTIIVHHYTIVHGRVICMVVLYVKILNVK